MAVSGPEEMDEMPKKQHPPTYETQKHKKTPSIFLTVSNSGEIAI